MLKINKWAFSFVLVTFASLTTNLRAQSSKDALSYFYFPTINCVEVSPNAGTTYQILVNTSELFSNGLNVFNAKLIQAKPGQPSDIMLIDNGSLTLNHARPLDQTSSGEFKLVLDEASVSLKFDLSKTEVQGGQAGFAGTYLVSGEAPAQLICNKTL